mmetsp:Transcript_3119/g.7222  ORF Transcript_3119/g.7222 Transcript_3119/m.7222 type:complete len:251 (-) Transcript_3119:195-947(-)
MSSENATANPAGDLSKLGSWLLIARKMQLSRMRNRIHLSNFLFLTIVTATLRMGFCRLSTQSDLGGSPELNCSYVGGPSNAFPFFPPISVFVWVVETRRLKVLKIVGPSSCSGCGSRSTWLEEMCPSPSDADSTPLPARGGSLLGSPLALTVALELLTTLAPLPSASIVKQFPWYGVRGKRTHPYRVLKNSVLRVQRRRLTRARRNARFLHHLRRACHRNPRLFSSSAPCRQVAHRAFSSELHLPPLREQ